MLTFVLLACKPTKYRHTSKCKSSKCQLKCINRHNGDLCVSRHFSKSKPTQKRRSQKCWLRQRLLYVPFRLPKLELQCWVHINKLAFFFFYLRSLVQKYFNMKWLFKTSGQNKNKWWLSIYLHTWWNLPWDRPFHSTAKERKKIV